MPPKRPKLDQLQLKPEERPVSITDTMTLVVKGDGGHEMRVKESGIASGNMIASQTLKTNDSSSEAVLNKIKFEDLRMGQDLGRGSQGKVRLVQHRGSGVKYALKCLPLERDTDDIKDALQSELRQVEALKHKNLVSSHEAFFRDGRLYIVLEYMNAGSMTDILKRHPEGFKEELLAYVAKELLQGLEHLHNLKMIHRDIKPANVLANSKGEVKIADFGVAKTFSNGDVETLSAQGSVPYMSPERIQAHPYSFKSDIWSAGLAIAECALGEYPFSSMKNNLFELCQAIATGTAKINWVANGREYSRDLIDFIDRCLLPVASRPTATELFSHPFIAKAAYINPVEAGRWFVASS